MKRVVALLPHGRREVWCGGGHRDADDPTCRNAGLVIGGALVFVKIKIPYSKRFQVVGVATKQRLRPPPLLSLSLSQRERVVLSREPHADLCNFYG